MSSLCCFCLSDSEWALCSGF